MTRVSSFPSTMARTTQTELARHLGVSRSAVAAVLSNSPSSRISPELKERILAAAEELGYIPNRFAQIMSKGRSGMIGIINFGGYEQLPHVKVEQAVCRVLREGYQPVVDNALWFADHGRAVCSRMIQMQVEGVALVHPPLAFTSAHLQMLLDAEIPVVGLGCALSGITRYLSDKEKGFHLLTTHLLNAGYRRLTLMVGMDSTQRKKQPSWHSANARAGFLRAISEFHGEGKIHGDVEVVRYEITPPKADAEGTAARATYAPGYHGMHAILKRPVLPEVVLCSNDNWAMGALAACADADVRVPEELAVTGFENDPMSRYGLLPLTTVAHPVKAIVDQGMGMLLEAIRTGTHTPDALSILPGELVVRKSCGSHLRQAKTGANALPSRSEESIL